MSSLSCGSKSSNLRKPWRRRSKSRSRPLLYPKTVEEAEVGKEAEARRPPTQLRLPHPPLRRHLVLRLQRQPRAEDHLAGEVMDPPSPPQSPASRSLSKRRSTTRALKT